MDGCLDDGQINGIDFTTNLCLLLYIPASILINASVYIYWKLEASLRIKTFGGRTQDIVLGTIRQDYFTLRSVNYLKLVWFYISKFMEVLG